MFQCRERSVAFPFINASAPHVVMILNNMCVDKPTREDQLTVTLEAIKIMEILVDLTEDHLSMFFCFLIHFFKISDRCRYSRLVDNPLDLYLVIVLKYTGTMGPVNDSQFTLVMRSIKDLLMVIGLFPQLLLGYGINCPLNTGVLHLSTSSGLSWRHTYLN